MSAKTWIGAVENRIVLPSAESSIPPDPFISCRTSPVQTLGESRVDAVELGRDWELRLRAVGIKDWECFGALLLPWSHIRSDPGISDLPMF